MEKLSLLPLLLLLAITSFSQTLREEAIAYNDRIISEQQLIEASIRNFSDALNQRTDPASYRQHLSETYNALKKQVALSQEKINAMPVFDNNTEFLKASQALFTFYRQVVGDEYRMIYDYMLDTAQTETAEKQLSVAIETMTAREAILDEAFAAAQATYADKYDMLLEEQAPIGSEED